MADETTARSQGFQAYHEQVNIGLYNDIVAFVMATTAADTMQVYRNLTSNHLWYCRSNNDNIQEQYGFRYFGELLERFEAKAGSEIRDIRAIALAMADTKDLFTDDMFVGNQQNNFIKKITLLSVGDIYLKGALYLLKKGESNGAGLLDVLTRAAYTQTEELVFVMSLYGDFEQAFLNFKPQLIKLLGNARTIRTGGNMNIYCWLIKQLHYCSKIKQVRTKDMALIRALMDLTLSFVKTGSRPYGVLLEAGYTFEEIIYLNSFILRHRPVSNTIDVDSIVAEKIAIEMCKVYINSENTHSSDAYEHLEWLLKKYGSFNIKINGYKGIYQAIEKDIKIANPRTFLWLFKIIGPKDVFRFDILNERWDILSCELEAGVYRKLFDEQLVTNSELTGAQITEHIQKYDALTGLPYLAQFEHEFLYEREYVFSLLVNKGVINLETSFVSSPGIEFLVDNSVDEARPPMLIYIRQYIKGIHSREAFDFFKYFFSRHNFEDMHRLFIKGADHWGYRNKDSFFVDEFYKGPARYYGDNSNRRFEIKRSFLSDDEHRELFGWLDDYMFQYKADTYIEFAVLLLADSFVTTLFPHNELRQIYDAVRDKDISIVKQYSDTLKNTFLSEAELKAELNAEEKRKKEMKRLEREQQLQRLRDELAAVYDGTFKSLLKYLDKHKYSFNNQEDAMLLAAKYLDNTLSEKDHVLGKKELGRFLIFSGKLLKEGCANFDTIKNHVLLIEEGSAHDENNRASESNPNA